MNKKLLFLGIAIIGLMAILAVAGFNDGKRTSLGQQNRLLRELAGPPPASLDQFFPPQAPAPVWLIEMFNLEGPFSGIAVNLGENDMQGAKANFEAFKAQWIKMSKMVPEWTKLFPMAPVNALGAAINSGDPSKIGPAMGRVGQACDTCHLINQTKSHQKYHWKNFDDVQVTDPVTNQQLEWVKYMTTMAGSFSGMGVDLQQGKFDNARKNFQDFSARFKQLPEGCKSCHDTPRTYFVDPGIQAIVDQLGEALQGTPDMQKVGQLTGAIGNESCMKCHLVHFPAQNRKDQWERFEGLFRQPQHGK
ncbi:MAG: hypothetical protein HYX87_05295 [Chloroflexi bacterium]|nr:hypothetical protein [Chloroflexota bacterium]